MAINIDSSDLTLSYRKVVQTELVFEVSNEKNFCFCIKSKDKPWVTSSGGFRVGGDRGKIKKGTLWMTSSYSDNRDNHF